MFNPTFHCPELFEVLFTLNLDYMSTFGFASLFLVSPVSNLIIHNSPGIHLLKFQSDRSLPLAKYQWTSTVFHLKTQGPYYGINVFSDLSCPSRILSFSCFFVSLPSFLLSQLLLSPCSTLPSIVTWEVELLVFRACVLELDALILNVEFP